MKRLLPILGWMGSYDRSWLQRDLIAGATVWAVLIPSALAYAGIVGVDPVVGLYTVPLALVGYALFGGSRLLVVGPDAALSVLSAATVAAVLIGGEVLELTIALALVIGVLYVVMSALHLGWVADLIPDPVLKGFIEGLVWVTILDQMPKVLGVSLEHGDAGFFRKLIDLVETVPDAQMETAILGVACIAALFAIKRLTPGLPGPLIVLVAAIATVAMFALDESGVAVVGETSGGLADFGLPSGLEARQWWGLVPGALAMVVLGFTQSVGAAKRSAEKTGERTDPDQELRALGIANLGAGLSGGFVVGGALSKTAVAISAGGRTQVGNLFAAVLGVLTLLFLLPLFETLAFAALGAIVIVAMYGLSDIGYFRSLWRIDKLELLIAVAALAGVLIAGVLAGVMIGVLLSLVAIVQHIGKPPTAVLGRTTDGRFVDLTVDATAAEVPGMLFWRQDAPLVFLNVRRLVTELEILTAGREDLEVLVIDCSAMSGVDSTGTLAFDRLMRDLEKREIGFWITHIRDRNWERAMATLPSQRKRLARRFATNSEAVAAFNEKRRPNDPGTPQDS